MAGQIVEHEFTNACRVAGDAPKLPQLTPLPPLKQQAYLPDVDLGSAVLEIFSGEDSMCALLVRWRQLKLGADWLARHWAEASAHSPRSSERVEGLEIFES